MSIPQIRYPVIGAGWGQIKLKRKENKMGEIADAMINGELCHYCGVYLEPNETVYIEGTDKKVKMPINGDAFGSPVVCEDCHDNL